ncbi:MAG: peptide deformylase [Gemmataceae bacterium]|nr:peptide deformylase [Gemmataceae bacterium]
MKIVHYPHPALRHVAKPLSAIDADVRRYAGQMLELMYAAKGLGLAAPQVALPYQLLVLNYSGDPNRKEDECVAINPVLIEKKGGTQDGSEGCLSFPDLYQNVRRAKTVVVRAYDLDGRLFEVTASDLGARLWQHEIDHLHGILYIDKMGLLGKRAARPYLEEFETRYRRAQQRGEIPSDEEIERTLLELEKAPIVGPLL